MKLFIPFALLLIMTACAPINKEQCHAGNWQGIGMRDGALGRSENFIASLAQECAKYGVSVDQSKWLKGRTEGLKTYCTVENAETLGRNGSRLNPVCNENSRLIAANHHGQKYYVLTQKLAELKDERNELEAILDSGFEGEITQAQRRLFRRYMIRLNHVNDDIRAIKHDLNFYPRYR